MLLKYGANIEGDCFTPLSFAVEKGHLGMARFLIESGADLDAFDCKGPPPALVTAVVEENEKMVHLLLDAGASVDLPPDWSLGQFATALSESVKAKNEPLARVLLDHGASPDAATWYGRTALHFAAEFFDPDIMALLIARGADVNARDNDGRTPLKVALDKGNTKAADLLRQHGGRE